MTIFLRGILCLWLIPLSLIAEVPVPALTGRVVDLTNTLSSGEKDNLSLKLKNLETNKGSQIAILFIPSIEPESIEEYSIRVAEKWKIGREKKDDGVIIIIAKNDRKIRIEVGYGLEGAIPDAYAKRIIEHSIIPNFKQGNFFTGIDRAVDVLEGLINKEITEPPGPKTKVVSTEGIFLLTLIGLFLGYFIFGWTSRASFSSLSGGLITFLLGISTFGGIALLSAILVFFILSITLGGGGVYRGSNRTRSFRTIGRSGNFRIGGGFGGFSGGGGSFGGGGASGSW